MKSLLIIVLLIVACEEVTKKSDLNFNDPIDPQDPLVTYSAIHQNIFKPKCLSCHNDRLLKGGLSLATYDSLANNMNYPTLISPGSPEISKLFLLIRDGEMPPKGAPVEPQRVKEVYWWIKHGALNN